MHGRQIRDRFDRLDSRARDLAPVGVQAFACELVQGEWDSAAGGLRRLRFGAWAQVLARLEPESSGCYCAETAGRCGSGWFIEHIDCQIPTDPQSNVRWTRYYADDARIAAVRKRWNFDAADTFAQGLDHGRVPKCDRSQIEDLCVLKGKAR